MIVVKLILLSLITFRIGINEEEFAVYLNTSKKFVVFLFAVLWLLVIFGYDVVILSKLYDTIIT